MANLTGPSQLDSTGIPTGSVKVPGVTNLKAIQGGNLFTDAGGDDSAPIRAEATPGSKDTYAASIANNAAYATPTDLFQLVGSATKLVKVLRMYISSNATSAGVYVAHFVKRTVANTGGTANAITRAQFDSADPGPTAVANNYSVVPTSVGAGVDIMTVRMFQNVLAGQQQVYILDFGNYGGEAITLRGVAQCFSVNFAGVALPAGSIFDWTIIWSEE